MSILSEVKLRDSFWPNIEPTTEKKKKTKLPATGYERSIYNNLNNTAQSCWECNEMWSGYQNEESQLNKTVVMLTRQRDSIIFLNERNGGIIRLQNDKQTETHYTTRLNKSTSRFYYQGLQVIYWQRLKNEGKQNKLEKGKINEGRRDGWMDGWMDPPEQASKDSPKIILALFLLKLFCFF